MNKVTSDAKFSTPRLPGEEGVWFFVFGDMLIFSSLFITYLYYRGLEKEIFIQSQQTLSQNIGVTNTLLLLTSSVFVVLAVEAVRHQSRRKSLIFFTSAWCCGFGFSILKIFEYRDKIQAGISVNTNEFFMYFYVLTGIHFMHVVIGMLVLLYLITKVRQNEITAGDLPIFESGATYWHMVDLLWIILFALLYLVK